MLFRSCGMIFSFFAAQGAAQMGIAGVRPSLGFLGFSARGPEGFFAPHRGALNEPPSAAGIAGSRPGGGPGFAALRPAGFFPHPFGALQMCRLRRRGLPGPAPAGGPTSCAPKKSAEEGRSRGAHLKKMGAQSSPPLRIPLPLTSSQTRVGG